MRLPVPERTGHHQFPAEGQQCLHEQLRYIRDEAQLYRRKFNVALLAEEAHKRLGYPVQRQCVRHLPAPRAGEERGIVPGRREHGKEWTRSPHR